MRLLFIYNWFILLNAWSDCTEFYIPTVELIIPTGTQTNKAKKEIETQPAIDEARIRISSYIFYSLNHYVLFHLKDNFLFHQFFLI